MKKLSEVLSGPDRWIKGDYAERGRMCLMGGVYKLLNGEHWSEVASVRYRLGRIIGLPDGMTVEEWNDAPERTWDEVAAVIAEYDADRMLHP